MSIQKTIEENMKAVLGGDLLENALNFVTHLRETGIEVNGNRFFYMNEPTCIIIWKHDENNANGEWFICDCPLQEHEGFPICESVKEYVQSSVSKCRNCGCNHEDKGATRTIFGKEFDNLCSSPVAFINPTAEELEKVKIMMELWKHIIAEQKKG